MDEKNDAEKYFRKNFAHTEKRALNGCISVNRIIKQIFPLVVKRALITVYTDSGVTSLFAVFIFHVVHGVPPSFFPHDVEEKIYINRKELKRNSLRIYLEDFHTKWYNITVEL